MKKIVPILVAATLLFALFPSCSYYDTAEEKADKSLLSSHRWGYDTIMMMGLIDSVFRAYLSGQLKDTTGMAKRIKSLQVFMYHMGQFAIEFREDGTLWVKGAGAKEGTTGKWRYDSKTIETELIGANDIIIKAQMIVRYLDSTKLVAINKALEKDLGLTTFVLIPQK
ncbi:hypothetical protein [Rhodoflexus sp.]